MSALSPLSELKRKSDLRTVRSALDPGGVKTRMSACAAKHLSQQSALKSSGHSFAPEGCEPEEIRTPDPRFVVLCWPNSKMELGSYRSLPVADDPSKLAPRDARLCHDVIFFRCAERCVTEQILDAPDVCWILD
jgi:hypothetical protein